MKAAFVLWILILESANSVNAVDLQRQRSTGSTNDLAVPATSAVQRMAGNFRPSLNMKETVDFLMAPGSFLQEVCNTNFSNATGIQHGAQLNVRTNAETFESDVILILRSPESLAHVLLFGRCWASSGFYSIAVEWAEPHGRGLYYGIYPPSLSIYSDTATFRINHDIYREFSDTFRKPIREPTTFTNMFGDYPITNIRFGDKSFSKLWVLAGLNMRRSQKPSGSDGVITRTSNITNNRNLATITYSSDRLSGIVIKDETGKLLERARFEYDADGLISQRIFKAEQTISASLPGRGAEIRYRNQVQQVKKIPVLSNDGGRFITIDYAKLELGAITHRMPTRIVMETATERLSEARFFGIKRSTVRGDTAFDRAIAFSAFSDNDRDYRNLLEKYWQRWPREVESTDRIRAEKLRASYVADFRNEENAGAQLKNLNIRMELNRILGAEDELVHDYELYLSVLEKHDLPVMLLVGGFNAFDTLVLWGRYPLASRMAGRWLERVQRICDYDQKRAFAQREFRKGNYWVVYLLFENLTAASSEAERFEVAGVRTLAIFESDRLLGNRAQLKDQITKTQAEWILQWNRQQGLDDLLADNLAEAKRHLAAAQNLTVGQLSLVKKLKEVGLLLDPDR